VPESESVLRLEGVRKTYGIGTPAEMEVLHGIDFELKRGEFAALIGPSGSGKSTLLNVIGLLDRPTSGRLLFEGQDTGALAEAELTALRGRAIGFVFQHHYLLKEFTALENVMMPMLAAHGRRSSEMEAAADTLLGKVGLTRWRDRRADHISGGQQQRVAIARALAMHPTLVLADEPTGNLDTQSADAAFALLREFNTTLRTTFLIVTHDPRLAQRCDRVIELVDGRIVSDRAHNALAEAV
jgi:lipoprotein-releasing system ATP-binding protein